MLSKWLPWDLERSHPTIIKQDEFGLHGLWFWDSHIERIFLDKITSSLSNESQLIVKLGVELTKDWLQENFNSISLFGNNETVLVLQSEKIPKDILEYLYSSELKVDSRILILSFTNDSRLFDKVAKNLDGTFYKITQPPFWHFGKLLNFLASNMNLKLSYDVQMYLLSAVENNCDQFVMCLNMIKLADDSNKEISLPVVQELISSSKVDQFKFAGLWAQKKYKLFLKEILLIDCDFDTFRQLFSFLQSHLLKLADTSYTDNKKSLSKYDKEIIAASGLWNNKEIKKSMKLFAELEVEAKKKSFTLMSRLRSLYFSRF